MVQIIPMRRRSGVKNEKACANPICIVAVKCKPKDDVCAKLCTDYSIFEIRCSYDDLVPSNVQVLAKNADEANCYVLSKLSHLPVSINATLKILEVQSCKSARKDLNKRVIKLECAGLNPATKQIESKQITHWVEIPSDADLKSRGRRRRKYEL